MTAIAVSNVFMALVKSPDDAVHTALESALLEIALFLFINSSNSASLTGGCWCFMSLFFRIYPLFLPKNASEEGTSS